MRGDRVILAVKYTPAASPKELRRAVGGFLRYVQYRDKHPDSDPTLPAGTEVRGLLKYMAYRDRATPAGRLFGPDGVVGDPDRRDFANFVARSIAATRPQKTKSGGEARDHRRAVYRFVISPERAGGLDLDRLTRAAMERLERESGVSGLRWIAAEHRNTGHPHVHLVVAGMRETSPGAYRGFLVTPRRLAAMKDELALEISRQRGVSRTGAEAGRARSWLPAAPQSRSVGRSQSQRTQSSVHAPAIAHRGLIGFGAGRSSVLFRLQAAALRYRRRMEREIEQDAARRDREWSR